jgi:hypothetical protein
LIKKYIMATINSFSSALDALSRNQTLKINQDGNLQNVSGFAKVALAFQRYIQKKTPDQLGTNQQAIAKLLVKLYKNENPTGNVHNLSAILHSAGASRLAETVKQLPNLETRKAEVKEAPVFKQEDEEIFGTFTRGNGGRAGVVSSSAKPPVDLRTHVPADEVAQAVKALNIQEEPQSSKPSAPKSKTNQAAPSAQSSAPKANVQVAQSSAQNEPLPDYLVSPEDIEKALRGSEAPASDTVKPVKTASGPSAARLSSAASHSREVAPPAQTKKAEKPLQPGQVRVQGFAFYAPQGDTLEKKIADVENRLKKSNENLHFNPLTGQQRNFNKGEKAVEVPYLQGELNSLRSQEGAQKAAQSEATKTPADFSTSTKSPAVLNLITSLKKGEITAGLAFASALFPHITQRLGADLTEQIHNVKSAHFKPLQGKDRHSGVLCPKETLVTLKGGDVHANYIPFKSAGDPAIATQAHKAETINDFVSLIEEKNVTTIIDLTNPRDRKKHSTVDYARDGKHFQAEVQASPANKIEQLKLKSANNHQATYFNFNDWPDNGVISVGELKSLTAVIAQDRQGKSGGITIHCNAGVGRTGTVFAALELNRLAQTGELSAGNFSDKVLDVVAEGRKARGGLFVQAPDQLALLFDYAKSLV